MRIAPSGLRHCLFSLFSTVSIVSAAGVQFYQESAGLALAVSTVSNGSSTDLLLDLSAPSTASYGALGIGSSMTSSLMFIILPAKYDGAPTISIRSATGHSEPNPLPALNYTIQNARIANGRMRASLVCSQCDEWAGGALDTNDPAQPWIWAIGPPATRSVRRDLRHLKACSFTRSTTGGTNVDQGGEISQHTAHGTFMMNMQATISNSSDLTPPVAQSSTSAGAVWETTGPNMSMVIAHAVLLPLAFFLLFPLGILGLRVAGLVRFHWMMQLAASVFAFIGMAIGIAFSLQVPFLAGFRTPHQIIGITAICCVGVQALMGVWHHLKLKHLQYRTTVSIAHVWFGRGVVLLGLINAPLGFQLAGSEAGTVASAAIIPVIVITTALASLIGYRRQQKQSARLWLDSFHRQTRQPSQAYSDSHPWQSQPAQTWPNLQYLQPQPTQAWSNSHFQPSQQLSRTWSDVSDRPVMRHNVQFNEKPPESWATVSAYSGREGRGSPDQASFVSRSISDLSR